MAFLVIVIFGYGTLYLAFWFANWWPTVFGIDGAWRGFLSLTTVFPLVLWVRFFEWGNFEAKFMPWVRWVLDPIDDRIDALRT